MRRRSVSVGLLLMAGCTSAHIASHQPYQGERLPQSGRVIVHDFVAAPSDLPAGSPLAALVTQGSPSPSATEADLGRRLGARLAEALVVDLSGMGLKAVRAMGQPAPAIDDVLLRG